MTQHPICVSVCLSVWKSLPVAQKLERFHPDSMTHTTNSRKKNYSIESELELLSIFHAARNAISRPSKSVCMQYPQGYLFTSLHPSPQIPLRGGKIPTMLFFWKRGQVLPSVAAQHNRWKGQFCSQTELMESFSLSFEKSLSLCPFLGGRKDECVFERRENFLIFPEFMFDMRVGTFHGFLNRRGSDYPSVRYVWSIPKKSSKPWKKKPFGESRLHPFSG